MTEHKTVLVTGATGNVGRQLVSQLLATDPTISVRALVRDPDAALPAGVTPVRGDLADPDSLATALDGVHAVFLLWPFFSAEGAEPVIAAIAEHARRVVYLSASHVRDDRGPEENGFWGQVEHLIEQTSLEWTFLRAGGFAANTLGWADEVRTGVVRWPYGDAGRSLIHEADIAAVAAHALTDDAHVGAKYVLTGPEVVTQAEQVRHIGAAIGRTVRWEELPVEQARPVLRETMGADYADSALAYWAGLAAEPEEVTDTVRAVTGRPARTFRQWALDHVDDFRDPTTAPAESDRTTV